MSSKAFILCKLSAYKSTLTGITWGWVKLLRVNYVPSFDLRSLGLGETLRPWTWLTLQVNYIDCLTGIPWGWMRPWTWLRLQVNYIEYFMPWDWLIPWSWLMLQFNYIEYFDWYTLRVGETLDLTLVTCHLCTIFDLKTLGLGETLDLTHVTSELYRIFWLVYPEVGWHPGLDSSYKSII